MNEEVKVNCIGKSGLTLQQVEQALAGLESAPGGISLSEDVQQWEPEKVARCREILQELVQAGRLVGHPQTCGLRAIEQTKYTEHLRVYATQSLVLYCDALLQVQKKLGLICALLGVEPPKTEEELKNIAKFCAIMIDAKHIPAAWVFSPRLENFLIDLEKMTEDHRIMHECENRILEKWTQNVMELDGIRLWEDWEQAHGKGFFKKRRIESVMQKRLGPYAKVSIDLDDIARCLRELAMYQVREADLLQIAGRYPDELFGLYYNENSDFSDIEKFLNQAKRMDQDLKSVNGYSMLQRLKQEDVKNIQVFFGTWRTFTEVQGAVYRLFAVNRDKLEPGEDYISVDIRMCQTWRDEIDKLKDWVRFNAAAAAARENGLEEVVAAYEDGADHDQVLPMFEKAYYTALQGDQKQENPQVISKEAVTENTDAEGTN